MIPDLLWILIGLQMVMGLFDTLYHHELTERLAWRPSQRQELNLHAVRNLLYAVLFGLVGWTEVHGLFAIAVAAQTAPVRLVAMMFAISSLSSRLPSAPCPP